MGIHILRVYYRDVGFVGFVIDYPVESLKIIVYTSSNSLWLHVAKSEGSLTRL